MIMLRSMLLPPTFFWPFRRTEPSRKLECTVGAGPGSDKRDRSLLPSFVEYAAPDTPALLARFDGGEGRRGGGEGEIRQKKKENTYTSKTVYLRSRQLDYIDARSDGPRLRAFVSAHLDIND